MTRTRTLLILVLVLALPATASAHATLEETVPDRGGQLDRAPAEVQLRFSEDVTTGAGAVRVFDGRGREVQSGAAETQGGRVTVALRPGLGDGGYTATYRIVSADSHAISGGFSFRVGDGGPGAQAVDRLLEDSGSGPVVSTAVSVARGVQYAAIALAAGTLLLIALGLGGGGPARLLIAAVAGAVSAVVALVLEAVQGDLDIGAVLGTRFGLAWALGAVAWVAVAALRRSRLVIAPVGGLLLLPAFAGHASVESPLMLLANVVHVAAISGWVGGVAVLATLGRRPPTGLLGRFSSFALVAVAVVLLTGTVQSIIELSAWSQLLDTAYGRAVLIKLGLFAVLLGFGAVNRRRLGAKRPLRTVLRAELAVGVVVLGVTGALATYAPGKVAATGPVSRSAVLGPARMELTVDPAAPGTNELHVYLFDRRTGAQWDRSKELTAQAERGTLRLPLDLRKAGPGHYVAQAATLPRPGEWTVTVTSRVSDFDQHETRVRVPVR